MMKWYFQRIKNIYHWLVSAMMVVKCGYPARKLIVIGVTGTDGKTTTCTLIYEILKAAGIKVGLVSTVEARIGDEVVDTGLHTTNPDGRMLQPLLQRMVRAGITHVVLEVTAHGLDQYRVLGCNFKIGVLTNITHEHLDDFITMDRYRDAKAKLFLSTQYSVLNKDDDAFDYLNRKCKGNCKIISYTKTKIRDISPALSGEYNLYNISAATTVANLLGVDKRLSDQVIKNFKGVKGRREEIKAGQDFRVIVDFAHTPNALEQTLKSLKTQKKLTVVFGCPGKRDVSKRHLMGNAALRWADKIIITADDPRHDDLKKIFDDATIDYANSPLDPPLKLRGGRGSYVEVLRIDDRREAIKVALLGAKKGDIVLLAGKGHEKSLAIGDAEIPWSDQEVAKEILKVSLRTK